MMRKKRQASGLNAKARRCQDGLYIIFSAVNFAREFAYFFSHPLTGGPSARVNVFPPLRGAYKEEEGGLCPLRKGALVTLLENIGMYFGSTAARPQISQTGYDFQK